MKYLSTLHLLQTADRDHPLDNKVINTHLELLKGMNPDKQLKLFNRILPFVKYFDQSQVKNASEVYSMWLNTAFMGNRWKTLYKNSSARRATTQMDP